MKKDLPVNFEIDAAEVRVVDDSGEQIGVLPLEKAVGMAEDRGLDLVLMSAKADPPVCKIMDYGKFKYLESKKASQARKRQHVVQIKEVKLRATTDTHDLEVKLKRARKFLEEGNKVKVSMRFRGREMAYANRGAGHLLGIAEGLSELAKVERQPVLEGRQMIMILAPLKKKQ